MDDMTVALEIARDVSDAGGRAYFVGGVVRDGLMKRPSKDIDVEVYGISPSKLREILARHGTVQERGASFGVLGLAHTHLDIAMPRRERRTGDGHRDFDVSVDPALSTREASRRRDFTINAMMRDVITGEIIDHWGGQRDLAERRIRHVSDEHFAEDALRVFRAAQFAARLDAEIAPETVALCRTVDVSALSCERVYEELKKALLQAERPGVFFRTLREMDQLEPFFPEVRAMIGVQQSPVHHPEGDVFEHTMRVLDCAAGLRGQAKEPDAFMLSALLHDVGKRVTTRVDENGKITSYGHERAGVPLAVAQLERLTNDRRLARYVASMTELHMRPNMLAGAKSKKRKTRAMFDLSVCPEDLILLARADASGKGGAAYDESYGTFLADRLADYREVMARPMVTGEDLIAAGLKPGTAFAALLARARQLHFAGIERKRALSQVLREYESNPANFEAN